ncbi:MAG: hypothetical protein SFT91_05470 [Rickettsiaceae bacterium]|nr:hypothetical protein [Rickettsiaceae bacterium]
MKDHFDQKSLLDELKILEEEHLDLNSVTNNSPINGLDEVTLQRIKKRKLFVKDRISYLRSLLFPDIIA